MVLVTSGSTGHVRRYNIRRRRAPPPVTTMDETPEELEQIRQEAAEIDVHRYQKRFRP